MRGQNGCRREIIADEEATFSRTLVKGLEQFHKMAASEWQRMRCFCMHCFFLAQGAWSSSTRWRPVSGSTPMHCFSLLHALLFLLHALLFLLHALLFLLRLLMLKGLSSSARRWRPVVDCGVRGFVAQARPVVLPRSPARSPTAVWTIGLNRGLDCLPPLQAPRTASWRVATPSHCGTPTASPWTSLRCVPVLFVALFHARLDARFATLTASPWTSPRCAHVCCIAFIRAWLATLTASRFV